MASDLAGAGAVAQAAVQLTEYILGSKTTTDTTGTSDTSANTTVSDETRTLSDVNTSSSTSSSTQNTTSPFVIQNLQNLITTALGNASDPTKTSGLLSGIIQTANDAMTSVFGSQKQSGLYNSAAAATQTNDILSRASADAASAILGYQTQEQGVAASALNQLGGFTAGSNTNSTTNTDVRSGVDVSETASTHADSNTNTTSESTSKTSSGISIICSWMHASGLLPQRQLVVSLREFEKLQSYSRKGYLAVAEPLLRSLCKDRKSLISRATISIFAARTRQVCALAGMKSVNTSTYGWIARTLVATVVFFPALYFFLQEKLDLLSERYTDNV